MTKPNDLDVLDPAPVEVVYRSERLEIRPFTLVQIAGVVRLVRPFLDKLLSADIDSEDGLVSFLMSLMSDDMESVLKLAAIVTGRPTEWLGEGNAADLVRLSRATYEVNRDFFLQEVVPHLSALMPWAGASTAGDGPTASSPSSNVGTA